MAERLYLYITGYLVIKLLGTETERFLNLCANRGIYLWKLKCIGGTYYAQVRLRDYRKMHPAVRKTGVRPVIVSRRGLPFVLHRNRKRGMFAAGVILCFMLILRLSLYIWDISVFGSYTHTPEQIAGFLRENGIAAGKAKSEIDCAGIEALLRSAFEDIGWVSAEIKGTRLIIRISETNLTDINPPSAGPQHIVAEKDGIVRQIVVRSGTPMVARGDVVKKGDILISGVLEIIGDGEALLGREAVTADGDVLLATYYRYEDSLKLNHTEKIYTGKYITGAGLYSGEKKLLSWLPSHSFELYDSAAWDYTARLTANLALPLRIRIVRLYEYYEQDMIYTGEEAAALLNQRLKRYLEALIAEDVCVTENRVVIDIGTNTARASGEILAEEQAWEYRAVEEEEWEMPETETEETS